MALSIDYGNTFVIFVPKADLQLVQSTPTEIRQLDIDAFRRELKDIEDSELGMPFVRTHNHNPPVTVGGVTLARVVEILAPYTVTFEDGQYAVNLVGANSNIGDVTNVNQVSIRSANSAGLTFSKEAQDSAFTDARVWVDIDNGLPGNQYPRGTPGDPVDNLADAQTIIETRNLPKRLHLRGNLVCSPTDDITDYNIEGESSELSSIDVQTGCASDNLVIAGLRITGDLNGNITASQATQFSDIMDFDGRMIMCGLGGTTTLGAGADMYDFIDCWSEVPGTGRPIIDCQNLTGISLQFRRYSGGLEIQNYSQPDGVATINMHGGRLVLDSTCTGGLIVVRGSCELIDNSGAGCTVNTEGLEEPKHAREMWQDAGNDPDNPKQILQNTLGSSYDEQVAGRTKEVRKSGNVTTITGGQ